MQVFETVIVETDTVACAGEGVRVGGHPKVYLNLAPNARVECPYCSKLFLKKGAPATYPPNQTSKF